MPNSMLKNLACLGIAGVFAMIVTCAGVIGLTGYFGYNQLKVEAERFSSNREQIVAKLKTDLDAKRYDDVINAGSKYILADDAELNQLVLQAKEQKEDQSRQNVLEPLIAKPAVPAASILDAQLIPFRSPSASQDLQRVIAKWKNIGDTPIRAIEATFTFRDDDKSVLSIIDYTLYAEFNNEAGVLPGETYTTSRGEGLIFFPEPNKQAASVDIQIVRVSERSSI